MPRFFIDKTAVEGSRAVLEGENARHIGFSLRMRSGEKLVLCNDGIEYDCTIDEISRDRVICTIDDMHRGGSEPDVFLTIYQALPKSDKMELIIQKTIELGASRIVPFISSRCIARPDEKSAANKLQRWKRQAEEAAKQCGRSIIPEIAPIITFDEMLEENNADIRLMCYEKGGSPLGSFIDAETKGKSVSVMIGAEGGFAEEEAEKAQNSGISTVWLGKRILRCETCPIAVTSIIMNLTGNM